MGRIPIERLPRSAGAPSIDKSALKALRLVDPDLVVFYSRWHIMPDCTIAKDDFGRPLEWPRFHIALWSERENRFFRVVTLQTPDCDFMPFDHRVVHLLRTDIVRVKGLKEAINYRARMREETKAKEKQKLNEARQDWYKDNRTKINEVVQNPKGKYRRVRDAKIFGFAGQTNRGTNHETIERTPAELGYCNDALDGGK